MYLAVLQSRDIACITPQFVEISLSFYVENGLVGWFLLKR